MVKDITDKDFDQEVIKAGTPVLVDLWAPWCGPCRMIGPVVEKLSTEYEGKVKFCRINVDENQKTAARYRVMSIPTLILFKEGKPAETVVGAVPESALKSKIDAHL